MVKLSEMEIFSPLVFDISGLPDFFDQGPNLKIILHLSIVHTTIFKIINDKAYKVRISANQKFFLSF